MDLRAILARVGALDWFEGMIRELGEESFRIAEVTPLVGYATWYPTEDGEIQSTLGGTVVIRGCVLRWRPVVGTKTAVIAFPPDEEDSGRPWRAWPLAMLPEDIRLKLVEEIRKAGPAFANYDLPILPATEWDYRWGSRTPQIDVVFTKKTFERRGRTFTELRGWFEGKRIELYRGGKRGMGQSPTPPDKYVRMLDERGRPVKGHEGISLRCTVHRGREGLNRILVIWGSVTTDEAKKFEKEQVTLQLGGSLAKGEDEAVLDWWAALGLDAEKATVGDIAERKLDLRRPESPEADTVLKAMKAKGVPDKDRSAMLARAADACCNDVRERDKRKRAEGGKPAESEAEPAKKRVLLKDTFAALGLDAATADLDSVEDAKRELGKKTVTTAEEASADPVCMAAREAYLEFSGEEPPPERLIAERPDWLRRAAKVSAGILHSKARAEKPDPVAADGSTETGTTTE